MRSSQPAFFIMLLLVSPLLCGMEVIKYREEIGTLKDHSANEDSKKKIQKQHEDSFHLVEAAMKSRSINPGVTAEAFSSKFGRPNAVDVSAEGERWLYRASKGKIFELPWYFFYFNSKKKLVRWECGHTDCE